MTEFDFNSRKLFSGPHLIGVLFVTAGVFALVSPWLFHLEISTTRVVSVGVSFLLFGLIIVSSYSGTSIHIREKKFREYVSIVGYKLGKWVTLPKILEVKLVSSSRIETNKPNGISPTLSAKITDYKVLLYSKDPKPILSFTYSQSKKAKKDALELANELGAKLLSPDIDIAL